ncbi:MAG: elongation factor G [Planctomycetota bacterium]
MRPELLRNFGIVAHIDAGKTTVSERILFLTGVEHRLGEVHEGTATMDWMAEERERGITIGAAVTHCPWGGHELQLIDTPGHVDFTAEVVRSLRVLDGAVVLLDGVAAVQAQTETVVRRAREGGLPLVLVVNKLDRLGADFEAAVADARAKLHPGVVAVQLPVRDEDDELLGVVDLVEERFLSWEAGSDGREMAVGPIPESVVAAAAAARESLCSLVAEGDEALEDRFLEEGGLSADLLRQALREAVLARRLVPALGAAALKQFGIQPILDAVVAYLPSPLERPPLEVQEAGSGRRVELHPDPEAPAALLAFKLTVEEHGELVYLRVFAGTVREGDRLVDTRDGSKLRLQPLLSLHADSRERIEEAGPGMLVALPGQHGLRTGDTLCDPERPLLLAPVVFPEPVISVTVEAKDAAEHGRLEELLELLTHEDPTLSWRADEDSGQCLLSGMGELHLEVAVHRLTRDFRLPVLSGKPEVKLRECLPESIEARGWLEVPTDPPERVEVRLDVAPSEEEAVQLRLAPGLPPLPAEVLTGLDDPRITQGWRGPQGLPLARTSLTLRAWSVEPEGEAPRFGTVQGAIQNALSRGLEGQSRVLEPQMRLQVGAPEEHLAAVLADLQQRQAEILSLDHEDGRFKVHARAAMSRLMAYSTALRSQTQGRGEFHLEPDGLAERGPSGA